MGHAPAVSQQRQLWAVNVSWHERPERRMDCYAVPIGPLRRCVHKALRNFNLMWSTKIPQQTSNNSNVRKRAISEIDNFAFLPNQIYISRIGMQINIA
ncbi:hypothetical protein LY632_04035 [Erythrobacter sp. SDW2]|uniref:hypothetical protein n=1 Tax=Erythrobacter sp. SDW2 TaxID=2907154 RepID=UPI001F479E63|nr:hypothetical protein [Erythrobacter sp. SDW2]UIP07579.1 hypothetical protein LY632_04035 [Erythrobacter sp. SDW2]